MLKNIPPIISPELLSVLDEMGHGDRICIGDGNFPVGSKNAKVDMGSSSPMDVTIGEDYDFFANVSYSEDPESGADIIVHREKSEDIKNKILDPMIKRLIAVSNDMASQPANVAPVSDGAGGYVINTMAFDDNATIYVDCDPYAKGFTQSEGVTPKLLIQKKKDQTIVMNYKEADEVYLNKYYLTVLDDDGEPYKITTYDWKGDIVLDNKPLENIGSTGDGEAMNDFFCEKIVWNINKASYVHTGETAGLYQIANPNSVTVMEGTTNGWMHTAGYFENKSGEWHNNYYKNKEGAVISVSKKDITGKTEVAGATFELTSEDLIDADWQTIVDENNQDLTLLEGGNGVTWKSDTSAMVIYGLKKGTCYVGVMAENGVYASIKLTVK